MGTKSFAQSPSKNKKLTQCWYFTMKNFTNKEFD